MKRILFEGNGFVPTIPADQVTAYTRVLLVNGSGDLGIIRYRKTAEDTGFFEIVFSENPGKYGYTNNSWRELLEIVKDKLTIYYI